MFWRLFFHGRRYATDALLARLEHKVDLLRNHLKIEYRSPFSERVQLLAASPATKIQAIEALRDETGMGLKEAKDAIEARASGQALDEKIDLLLQHFGIQPPEEEEWQRLARDPACKIAAIKAYRTATGASLRAAKDAVELYIARGF